MIIDSHHHLWNDPGGFGDAYDVATLRADLAGSDVGATVYVECYHHYDPARPAHLRSVAETEWAAALLPACTAGPRIGAAIVGNADLTDPATREEALGAHVAAGQGRLRGIRQCTAWDPDPTLNAARLGTREGMMLSPEMRGGLELLGAHDLHYETYLYHPQLGELAALARSVPQVPIVLNHVGTPLFGGRHDDPAAIFADWREGMAGLADCRNVVVKIGGLLMHQGVVEAGRRRRGGADWTAAELIEALRPWVAETLALFGPGRCLFESNFPMDRGACTYPVLLAAYRELLAGLPAADQDQVLRANAARLYRISD